MGFSMKYHDAETVSVYLKDIENVVRDSGVSLLSEAGDIVKRNMQLHLNHIRTDNSDINYKHMADDVIKRTITDKYGDKIVRVRGGQATGTLWHIVNDGTYRTRATHFMDYAMDYADVEIERLIDQELKKAGL